MYICQSTRAWNFIGFLREGGPRFLRRFSSLLCVFVSPQKCKKTRPPSRPRAPLPSLLSPSSFHPPTQPLPTTHFSPPPPPHPAPFHRLKHNATESTDIISDVAEGCNAQESPDSVAAAAFPRRQRSALERREQRQRTARHAGSVLKGQKHKVAHDVTVPHVEEETVECVMDISQERSSKRIRAR